MTANQAKCRRYRASHRVCGVYVLVDPRDSAIRYVGCTTTQLRQRLHVHNSHSRAGKNHGPSQWIRDLEERGLRAEIRLVETCEPESLEATEGRWIVGLGKAGHDLLNHGYDWLAPAIDMAVVS